MSFTNGIKLQEILEHNYEATVTMLKVYTPYSYLLSADTEKKVVDFNAAKHSKHVYDSKYESDSKSSQSTCLRACMPACLHASTRVYMRAC